MSTLAGTAHGFNVQSLGVTFDLPPTFKPFDDPELVFLARSTNPRAVFSIDAADPDITTYDKRPGERLSTIDLRGLKNVVIIHSAMSGLPEGIEANELLVTNGARSFSVIMSAPGALLPDMWQTFVTSLRVA